MSFGIVMNPLSQEFGWTRTSLSTIVFITSIVTGLMQMIVGLLVDRFGPRLVMGIGVALLGLGVWLLTVSTNTPATICIRPVTMLVMKTMVDRLVRVQPNSWDSGFKLWGAR